MSIVVLAYLGGLLTILSPCILPVLPFVFARAGQPATGRTLPMLTGMALTFALVGTLATVGGSWAVQANTAARYLALAVLALSGLALIVPQLAERLMRPLVALGNRLAGRAGTAPTWDGSVLLGIATGLIWAPCAGPILGLVLTSAALNGANAGTALLLLAYAAGAATSLAVALHLGRRGLAGLALSPAVLAWVRRGLGAAVVASVVAIGLGADTGLLARLSTASTTRIEQALLDASRPSVMTASTGTAPLLDEGAFPSLSGAGEWLNSPPLNREGLQGKVVLVNFWTYSCINCIRTLPYIRAWAEKYRDEGLVVIGVHTPEFAFEKSLANVRKALANLQIGYPVAIDNDYKVWRAFGNHYWPAQYLIDAEGRIRYHHFGEGNYAGSERAIQALLAEAGRASPDRGTVTPQAKGAEAPPDGANLRSGETYLGYGKATNFASREAIKGDAPRDYTPAALGRNQWALAGNWTVSEEQARLNREGGAIAYRFEARDLHLVLGPGEAGRRLRFRVTIDGAPPGDSHGADTDADGNGTIDETRLYQLVRQAGEVKERTFEIRFLGAGAEAFAFTFG
jgi:cytochrome c biogenesis protein CcdA/thiol-disulfide isomerase/thioredoxin